MDTALLIARLILAGVFLVAGAAKLLDREGSRRGLEGFGVPPAAAGPGAVALPIVEIVVGFLLLPVSTAIVGGFGALALLLVFVGGIAYNMSKGRNPDCHCFGQLHSEPAGWSTLIRNGVFAAIALFLVIGGWSDAGHSLVGWIGDLSTGEVIIGIIALLALAGVAAEGWLLVHLLGQNGRLLLRLDAIETMVAEGGAELAEAVAAKPAAPAAGLPEGTPAPAFRLEGVFGETMTLDALRAQGKPVMLIFSDPGCGPCTALLPEIARWQRDHAGRLTTAVVSRGTAEANRGKVTEHGLSHVLLQKDREVSNEYKAYGTPTAVIVKPDGTIGSAVVGGAEAIRTLVSKATGTLALNPTPVAPSGGNGAAARPAAPVAPAVRKGENAPEVRLSDLEGREVSLTAFKGKPTALLFWNPGCGFCKRMVDDLKKWETKPPKKAPRLLIISTGTADANRELGLKSTTVLDQGFAAGRQFGASGTPSAVLVDAQGRIASDVAVGAPGVLALLNGEDPKRADANGGAPAVKSAKKGETAPAVKLPDLDGAQFDLASRKGEKTLLLFWNPGCGFCKRMVPEVQAFEAGPPAGGPGLVLVSTGTPEANREMGLSSLTLLDQGFNTGRAFGASGTPSAVLIDEQGKIASDVAVGAPAVLALAGVTPESKPASV